MVPTFHALLEEDNVLLFTSLFAAGTSPPDHNGVALIQVIVDVADLLSEENQNRMH